MIDYKTIKIVNIRQKINFKRNYVEKILILSLIKIQENFLKQINKIFKWLLNAKIQVR